MEQFITPNRIANAILQKTSFKGVYIIVEGNNDYTLYSKFTNKEICKAEIAFGNQNVIDVIDELGKRGFTDALGIVDSDFRKLDGEIEENENILMTDDHDLEMMIFKSDALDTVLDHYSKQEKIEAFQKENGNKCLRDIFLDLAMPLGYLKWANKKNELGLVFKPTNRDGNLLNISEFIPPTTMKFSTYEDMVQTVLNYSINKSKVKTSKTQAVKLTKELINKTHSLLQLCNGHDIIHIIALSLRRKLSNLNANAIKLEQLEKEFVFAYDSLHFQETELYKQLKIWEHKKEKAFMKF